MMQLDKTDTAVIKAAVDRLDETQSIIRCLTKDLIDRIADIFLTAVCLEHLDPADYTGEKLGIVITLEGPKQDKQEEVDAD